ncbi:High-affinity branched-chain amino acid transport system permease protein LivH [Desulfurella amilsii]|uniref:High-affinity branched-chain amino acid transport system permease protein LivH n=1 Tax=Desulfurella amilsii TaxID=1562698 RepID=A0A1X4XYR6_9BACT|nr:branched-chain amino acid ABC transporter permease [Desulfurella amilsii]OSS42692.1 High-affinity branched-chain amino acid transport system permease protein LivH [Desulfurella amilsii]
MLVWVNAIINGVLIGLAYAIAALGLNLIWGVMKVINLSHGAFIALGMFAAYLSIKLLGFSVYTALIPIFIAGLAVGTVAFFVSLYRVLNEKELSTLLSTYALSLIIIGLGTFFFTTNPRAIDTHMGSFTLGYSSISYARIIVGVVSLLLAAALYLFLFKTSLGKAIRAVSQNPTASKLYGINTTLVLSVSFGIGVAFATVSGALIASLFPFTILSGSVYELKSFVICVLGGLGSPAGAILGGLILGLLENILTLKIPVDYMPFIEFTILVIILLIKPSGLWGRR